MPGLTHKGAHYIDPWDEEDDLVDEVYALTLPVQANISAQRYASALEEDRILKRVIQRVRDKKEVDSEERVRMDKGR